MFAATCSVGNETVTRWVVAILREPDALKGAMTKHEMQELTSEVLATHTNEINKFKKGDETLEYLFPEKWNFWDVIDSCFLTPIKGFTIALIRLASKPKTVCIIVLAAVTFEALHFHSILEPTRPQIVQEYSDQNGWTQQATQNANTALIYEFVEMPRIPPHIPEGEFHGIPQNARYVQLTGFSPTISGQYYQ
jgi:hypothetical protein